VKNYLKGDGLMKKGSYSTRYDPDKLREMIEDGLTAKEIIKALKISPYTLQEHLVMLQNLDKKVYVIKGLFHDPEKESTIKREGVVFSREMLEKTGFTPGDSFEMEVKDDRIILKKIKDD
jgi:hypothetical protein